MKYLNYFLSILKKVVYIIFIIVLIFKALGLDIKDVFAVSPKGWGEDEDLTLTSTNIIQNGQVVLNGIQQNVGGKYSYVVYINEKKPTYSFITLTDSLSKDYLYSLTMYFCSNNGDAAGYYDFDNFKTSKGWNNPQKPSYYNYYILSINPQPYLQYPEFEYGSCQTVNVLFQPALDSNYIQVPLNSTTTSNFLYFGYKLKSLGLSSSAQNTVVKQIIDNAEQNKDLIINNQDKNHEEQIKNDNSNQQQTNDRLDKIDDTMKDDNVDTNSSSGFFNDFDSNSHGLSSMITIPLNYINSWTQSCSPISMPILGENVQIPCMSTTYKNKLGNSLYLLLQICVSAPIAYAIICYYIKSVSNAQNPDDNRLEVTDL